ncbi:nuclear transport factor 2 family protein [Singulisphaera sp. Ch08]|uniref:Nuclear transport factor 2 family protein n=1 Tax=Singulisphaera sp. Ch08 TaxID=3120278 RepID=A0AAU7C6V5_9BACT
MSATLIADFIDRVPQAFREGDPTVTTKDLEVDNVLLLQSLFQAIAQGDFAAFAELLAEDVSMEILGTSTIPFLGAWQSRQEVAEAVRTNFAMIEEQRPMLRSIVAQGNTVVVEGCEQGRLRGAELDYDVQWFQFHTFSGGKLVRMRQIVTDTRS